MWKDPGNRTYRCSHPSRTSRSRGDRLSRPLLGEERISFMAEQDNLCPLSPRRRPNSRARSSGVGSDLNKPFLEVDNLGDSFPCKVEKPIHLLA